MKQLLKSTLVLILALVMVASSLIVVSAEAANSADEDTVITAVSDEGNAPRAYELVWKFKYQDEHLWKRRWNATLGAWYDPAWILVW